MDKDVRSAVSKDPAKEAGQRVDQLRSVIDLICSRECSDEVIMASFNDEQRSYVEKVMEQDPPEQSAVEKYIFLTESEQIHKYKLLKEYYPKQIRRELEKITVLGVGSTQTEKMVNRKLLQYFSNIELLHSPFCETNTSEVEEYLNKHVYGLINAKRHLLNCYNAIKSETTEAKRGILLVGDRGCGKTFLIEQFVRATKLELRTINVGGMNDVTMLRGTSRNYENGDVSYFMRLIKILSMVYKKQLYGYAFTGELDLMGNVWEIGRAKEKLCALEQVGISKMFLPRQNYEELKWDKAFSDYGVELIPIGHIDDLMGILF